MIISFCLMLIELVIPKIFYGSLMAQWTSKGYKILSENDLFEENMIKFKTFLSH